MTKEVIISVIGVQNGPQMDGEAIETLAKGEYFFKNGKHYVLFEEVVEGESKAIKNRIKFAPGYMELSKSGPLSTKMVFEENKKNFTHYMTPFGSLMMDIEGKKVVMTETDDQIHIAVEYRLEVGGEFMADCDIKICIKAKDKAVAK